MGYFRDPHASLSRPAATQMSAGRHFKRTGASFRGTMQNWVSAIINSRIAEREKRNVSDRAWDHYTNDAMSHGLIEGLLTEIVGTGLTPQAQPMLRWLKQPPEWQIEYQQQITDIFNIWGLDPRNWCDAQRRLNIYMLQALALFQWKLDGIGIFQVISKPGPGRLLSLCVLPIDPSRLVTPSDLRTNENVYDGIKLDKDGAPKSVYILKPTQKTYSSYLSAKRDDCIEIPVHDEQTGLPKVLLVSDTRNIAEYRQDSILGSMIKEVKDSVDLVDAAIVKTLITNMLAIFIEDTMATNRSNLPIDQRIQQIDIGTILTGTAGEKPVSIANDAPGPGYRDINESIIGRLGMATCRGPENVAKAYNSSYSASQASIENAGKFDDVDRAVLVNRFCQPLHMWLQYEAAINGLLPVKSISHFRDNMHSYCDTVWMPPKLRPIDKLKSANARRVDLEDGSTNYQDIYGERCQDWRVARRQTAIELQYDRQLEQEMGLPEGTLSGTRSGGPVPTPAQQSQSMSADLESYIEELVEEKWHSLKDR